MTVKYHISKDGMARKCTAKSVGTCRAEKPEGLDQHYGTMEEAQTAYESSQKPLSLSPLKRPMNLPKVVNLDNEKFDEKKYVQKSLAYFDVLEDDEKEALSNYVQSSYDDINSYLYGTREAAPYVKREIEALDRALAKCTVEPPKPVWRSFSGTNLNKTFHENNHKVGETITFDGFTSTAETATGLTGVWNSTTWYMQETDSDDWETEPDSYKIKVPDEYSENGDKGRNTVLCIRPKSGAPVSMLRGRATEQEWLIPRGAKFKVSEIYEDRILEGSNMGEDTYAHVYVLDEI